MSKINIKDLKNPKAFDEVINKHKKILNNTKCCFHPTKEECFKNIIGAHTLSNKSILAKIEENGHLYGIPTANPAQQSLSIKKLGIKNATIFQGFCGYHDTTLFKCLDDEQFICSDKQIFMLTYRSICRELFKLELALSRLPTPDSFQRIHGKSNEEFNQNINDVRMILNVELQTFKFAKEKFDNYLVEESWHKLKSEILIFEIDDKPDFAATGAFLPKFNIDGVSLSNEQLEFYKQNEIYSVITVSVIPSDKFYFAIFSYLPEMENISRNLIYSVQKSKNKSLSIFNLILNRIENFVLRPSWYDRLTDDEKNLLNSKVGDNNPNPVLIDLSNIEKYMSWKFCNMRSKLFAKFKCERFIK